MNKLFLTLISISILTVVNSTIVHASTPIPSEADNTKAAETPAVSTSSGQKEVEKKLNQQINQLKDRIASRVAELNLVEKKGAIGTVTESADNKITFIDLSGKTRYIEADEITKFSSSSAKSDFGLSDLIKGTKISVLGLYNKQSQRILARFIDTITTPTFLTGRIARIDKKNFQITILSQNKKEALIDIQTITVISAYSQDDGISKIGFSKLNIGDRVMITGYPDKKDNTMLVASRILDLAVLPENPKIVISEPTEEAESSITPSSSSKISTSPASTLTKIPTKIPTKTPTKAVTKTPTPAE